MGQAGCDGRCRHHPHRSTQDEPARRGDPGFARACRGRPARRRRRARRHHHRWRQGVRGWRRHQGDAAARLRRHGRTWHEAAERVPRARRAAVPDGRRHRGVRPRRRLRTRHDGGLPHRRERRARLVGPSKAKDIVFSGRFVKADEALEIGLVDELVEPGTTYEAALAKVKPFVNGPRVALRAAKEAINRGLDGDLATGLAIESQLFTGLFATKDREIGMRSFVEQGPGKAQFEGR